ncbi:MAG TPA: NAD(P)H-hydrate dehydratase [Solirubrobacteraceae bacterium]|jgi:NAD(P)H-hydrate epimerase
MRAIDRWAIQERGISSLDLMERAGVAVTRTLEQLLPDGPVAVVCGSGNNGGDGLVVARLLRNAGRAVSVICTRPHADLSGDARVNLERLPGEPPLQPDDQGRLDFSGLAHAGVILDALLGTGFEGQPRGHVAEAIKEINASQALVLSVDIPSGVDASSGVVASEAVAATATVTFHASKPGLWIHPGKALAGSVVVADIGIPRNPPAATDIGLIAGKILDLVPRRRADSTKFSSGHVLVAGGSRDLTGAPRMSAQAAMRAGAGYVTALVPASLQPILASASRPELMTRGLPESEGAFGKGAAAEALQLCRPGGSLVLGPGIGTGQDAGSFARELAREAPCALVLDADGLGAHADALGGLAGRNNPTVLTPHTGELGRLLGLERRQIEAERLLHVRAAAKEAGSVVLLKGDDTLIADPSGLVAVSPGGSPGLATAGTGDVLSGVIAALLAKNLDAFTAACAGVWMHLRAGREAARRIGGADGVIASDVIDALPAMLNDGNRA